MRILLSDPDHPDIDTITTRCILGLQHEKQHQELFFTDIKYSFSKNPLFPAYKPLPTQSSVNTDETAIEWVRFEGGLVPIGQEATKIDRTDNFYFDNESPAHQVFLAPFSLANRLVTNKEFQAFIDDGGYKRPEFWLSDGWDAVQKNGWQAPLHWVDNKNQPGKEFTLYGLQERQPNHPVCHVSGYEADAYANWAGERLPTETEWEWAAKQQPMAKKPKKPLHPESAENNSTLIQLYDQCWQWTGSAYRPYPGFEPPKGAIGEYNGKFMCNQWVLRGGSCVSPDNHLRTTYRNFFYPEDRWQFSGIRLAKK
jgi:ergothioneine biosynthesis protein EgtB